MKRRISRRVVGVVSAVALVVIAALAIALFSHSIEPAARRTHNQWADFATVYGRLHNGNGRTVRNGDVLLCGHACFSARATLNGEFSFYRIPPGTYRLYAVQGDCSSHERIVVTQPNTFTALSLPLTINQC